MRISTRLTTAVILLVVSCFVGAVLSMRNEDHNYASAKLPPQYPDILISENAEVKADCIRQEEEETADNIRLAQLNLVLQEEGEADRIRLAQLNLIMQGINSLIRLVQRNPVLQGVDNPMIQKQLNYLIKEKLEYIRQYIADFIQQYIAGFIQQENEEYFIQQENEDFTQQEKKYFIQRLDHYYVQKDTENCILGYTEAHILKTTRGRYILKDSNRITPTKGNEILICPICLVYMENPTTSDGATIPNVITTECGHSFHSKCLLSALKSSNRCPYCAEMLLLMLANQIS